MPRLVTATPAAAGPATADVTPGTTLTVRPAGASTSGLLGAPAEHERVAALEPDDVEAGPGERQRATVDVRLRRRARVARSCRRCGAPTTPGRGEDPGADEAVVDDGVGPAEQPARRAGSAGRDRRGRPRRGARSRRGPFDGVAREHGLGEAGPASSSVRRPALARCAGEDARPRRRAPPPSRSPRCAHRPTASGS